MPRLPPLVGAPRRAPELWFSANGLNGETAIETDGLNPAAALNGTSTAGQATRPTEVADARALPGSSVGLRTPFLVIYQLRPSPRSLGKNDGRPGATVVLRSFPAGFSLPRPYTSGTTSPPPPRPRAAPRGSGAPRSGTCRSAPAPGACRATATPAPAERYDRPPPTSHT